MTLYYTLPGGPPDQQIQEVKFITVNPQPAPPVTNNIPICHMSSPSPLTAVALPGHTLTWYIPGSTTSAISPIPSSLTIGTSNYEVTQTSVHGCESNKSNIVVETLSAPTTAPTAPIQKYCQGDAATPLTITSTLPASTTAQWFNTPTPSPTETALPSAPIPGTTLSDVGTKVYGVKLVSTIGCGESPITSVPVTVNPKPIAPTDPAATACQNGTISLPASLPLPPTGHNVVWWGTNATGGSPSTPSIPSTNTAGTQTFYASFQNSSTTCESDRTAITFTVHPLPDANILGTETVCQNTPVTLTLRATGGLPSNYSFVYQEIGGPGGPVTVAADPTTNEFSINTISTATPGTKSFKLLSITDGRCPGALTA
jgi:hypothetical protein